MDLRTRWIGIVAVVALLTAIPLLSTAEKQGRITDVSILGECLPENESTATITSLSQEGNQRQITVTRFWQTNEDVTDRLQETFDFKLQQEGDSIILTVTRSETDFDGPIL